eukprot:TRINITY_DN1574_c0_g1_i1.p1 TRINITY_DN1574_c0_g1~~TRINITY_DN1574_c0_g1_i1.p1  ORF type:complete len:252 (-),score=129.91 TRINITY_DN1574_c0_g1_i1:78-803(-)
MGDEGKAGEGRKDKLWLPLESNPDLMNNYVRGLGMNGNFQFHDVYGTDPELLGMVPQPVLAVMLLFPITEQSEAAAAAEKANIEANGQVVDPALYYMKQTVGNACGTVAMLHAVMNNYEILSFEEEKFFAKFHAATKNMTPDERAAALEVNDDIEVEHQAVASQGESRVEDIENVNLHFIAFVHVNGSLYELDGRKAFPINHGPTTADTLLTDAVQVVRQFIDRDPENVRFNMVALGPSFD